MDRLYSNRTWVKHKEWKAYPKLRPIPLAEEEEVVVGEGESASSEQKQAVFGKKHAQKKQEQDAQKKAVEAWGQVEVVPGVFYVNSFEPLISVSVYMFSSLRCCNFCSACVEKGENAVINAFYYCFFLFYCGLDVK